MGSLHEKRRDTRKLHQFLMSLDADFYGPIRTNILSQDLLPSLNRAYQLVIQAERVQLAHVAPKSFHDVVSYYVRCILSWQPSLGFSPTH